LGLLDAGGYYRRLIAFLDHVTAEGFVRPMHRDMVLVDTRPGALLDRLAAYRPPVGEKLLHRGET